MDETVKNFFHQIVLSENTEEIAKFRVWEALRSFAMDANDALRKRIWRMVQIGVTQKALAASMDMPPSTFRQIGCNTFDGPTFGTSRWTQAPKLYVRTIDEAGAPIDAVTLDTVQNAMIGIAAALTGGKFGLASVERGTESREGRTGYITVKWGLATDRCGFSSVAVDGGAIQLNPQRPTCGCNGSKIYARGAAHELGHALGYWHTDSQSDLMFGGAATSCDAGLSAREQQAVAYHYR